MRTRVALTLFALMTIALPRPTTTMARSPQAPVRLYDLTYTLAANLDDPNQVRMTWDHCHLVAALQGIVNRDQAQLYIRYVESQHRRQNVDDYWLDLLTRPGAWLAKRPIQRIDSLMDLVTRFRSSIEGVVLYDPAVAATSNLASTIAGIDNLLPIRFDRSPGSVYMQLVEQGPHLPVKQRLITEDGRSLFTGRGLIPGTDRPSTGSAKCDAYLWMKIHYLDTGRGDGAYGAYYLDQYWLQTPRYSVPNHHCLTNHDFFISKRAFFFDLGIWADEAPIDDPAQRMGTDLETLKALLLSAYHQGGRERMIHIGGFVPWAYKYTNHGRAGGTHAPVPSEWEYGKIISAYNGFMDADAIGYGAMANASFFAHYPLRDRYAQPWVTHDDLRERGYLTDDGRVQFKGRDFVIFYVGDYDCAAWLYQRTLDIWDDPARGSVPLMWSISPVLDRRAPMAMDYIRSTAGPRDYFVAADNGAGYCEPGMLQEPRGISGLPSGLDAWAQHNRFLYDRWGLRVTGFIIYAHGPELNQAGLDCYATFSPNGIVPQRGPATLLHDNMPVLRHDHDINEGNPRNAAQHAVTRIAERRDEGHPPFHWFRNILKSPAWYREVVDHMHKENPQVELLDAPTFFELYRIFLKNHPDRAQGKP